MNKEWSFVNCDEMYEFLKDFGTSYPYGPPLQKMPEPGELIVVYVKMSGDENEDSVITMKVLGVASKVIFAKIETGCTNMWKEGELQKYYEDEMGMDCSRVYELELYNIRKRASGENAI